MDPRNPVLSRLHNQQILHPVFRNPGEVVAQLCAIQAQDYYGALWSVGLRMPAATASGIREALDDRKIIRTWLLRGTLHLVAPEDIREILALVAPHIIAGSAGRHRQLGLSEPDFAKSREIFSDELRGGKQLTRDELFRALEKAGISPAGQRGYHLLATAGLAGLICFGTPRGKQQTFVLLDEWIPDTRSPGQKKALGWLAERYFSGHGPATLQDFVWWSGLNVSDAKAGMREAGSLLSSFVAGGKEYLVASGFTGPGTGEPAAYLLPGYDEYILGYRDRSAVLDTAVAGKTVIGANGTMLPTIVIDGTVAGIWKRTIKKQDIAIELRPFSPFSPEHRRSVAAAAKRYGAFMGMPVAVKWNGNS